MPGRINYEEQPRIDFSIFKNKFASSSKHPYMTGEVEIPKEFLREMAEQVKRGVTPVCKVASWPREARKTNDPYQFIRIELQMPVDWDEDMDDDFEEEDLKEEESDDGLPF